MKTRFKDLTEAVGGIQGEMRPTTRPTASPQPTATNVTSNLSSDLAAYLKAQKALDDAARARGEMPPSAARQGWTPESWAEAERQSAELRRKLQSGTQPPMGGVQTSKSWEEMTPQEKRARGEELRTQRDLPDMEEKQRIMSISDPVERRAAMDRYRAGYRSYNQKAPNIPEPVESKPTPFDNKKVGDFVANPYNTRKGFKLVINPETGRETWVSVERFDMPDGQAGPPEWREPTPEELEARREASAKKREEAIARREERRQTRWNQRSKELTARAKLAGFTDDDVTNFSALDPSEVEKRIRIREVQNRKAEQAGGSRGGRMGGFGGRPGISESFSFRFKPNTLKCLLEAGSGAGSMGGGTEKKENAIDDTIDSIGNEIQKWSDWLGTFSSKGANLLNTYVRPFLASGSAITTPPGEFANTTLGRIGALGQSPENMKQRVEYYGKIMPKSLAVITAAAAGDPRTLAYYQG